MPNARSPERVPLNVWVDPKLLAAIEDGRRKLRGMDRSQFIRDALKEKLQGMGYEIPDEIVLPTDRAKPLEDLQKYRGSNASSPSKPKEPRRTRRRKGQEFFGVPPEGATGDGHEGLSESK